MRILIMKKNKLSIATALIASTIAFAPAGLAFADSSTTATTGGTVTFQSGDLTLSSTPSAFDFGTKTVVNSSTSYDSTEDKSGDNIAVDDLRGTGNGWNLQASLTEFSNGNTGQNLTGATISFDQTTTNQYSSALTNGSGSVSSTGTSTTILSADSNQGMGNSNDSLSNIKLNVPASTAIYAKGYSATMTWTLGNTPTTSAPDVN